MRYIHIYTPLLAISALIMSCQNSVSDNISEENEQKYPDFITSNPMTHDPVMAKENGKYYIFSTGMGISRMSSTDMKSWRLEKPCLDTLPNWLYNYIPQASMHIWAPDIIKKNGKWHLFYSCSLFGKNKSVIGHAIADELSSDKWTDCGPVVYSVPNRDMWNAIDPNIVEDNEGNMWMVFGSFWNGIMMVRLSDDLSAPIKPEEWYNVSSRHRTAGLQRTEPGDGAVEAPFIFKKNGWYYLFVSFDYCCKGDDSTYKVAVGRSRNVTGPYIDKDGIDMAHGGGTIVLEGDKKVWTAVGHCAVYSIDGRDVYISHAYEHGNGTAHLVVLDVNWTDDEWPIINWE